MISGDNVSILLLKPRKVGPPFPYEDLKQELMMKSSSKHIDTVIWHNSRAPFIAGNGDLHLNLHMRRPYACDVQIPRLEHQRPTFFQLWQE
jgi:hypothetical protein